MPSSNTSTIKITVLSNDETDTFPIISIITLFIARISDLLLRDFTFFKSLVTFFNIISPFGLIIRHETCPLSTYGRPRKDKSEITRVHIEQQLYPLWLVVSATINMIILTSYCLPIANSIIGYIAPLDPSLYNGSVFA